MGRSRTARPALALLASFALGACGALQSLDSAGRPLATFQMTAPEGQSAGGPGPAIFVDEPSAATALATERILIKPSALQVAYLPDGRWVDAAPAHVRGLLASALGASGRLGFVTTRSVGPLPDYVLLTDLQALQAEIDPAAGAAVPVVVRMTLTLVRDSDGRIVGSRGFERRGMAADSTALALVPAFDLAMNALLRDATAWIAATASGGGV